MAYVRHGLEVSEDNLVTLVQRMLRRRKKGFAEVDRWLKKTAAKRLVTTEQVGPSKK